MSTMRLPELLSPAGNLQKMKAALHFGADAVYCAGKQFGMRAAGENFSMADLKEGIGYAHRLKKQVYVTVNVMPREDQLRDLEEYLESLASLSPDGVIVADLGVFDLCRKRMPMIPIHISTQAATVNSAACNRWYEMGARRVVLARELSLREIEEIRKHIPDDLELEVFVHGSMCVSFSGRCMLSEYYTGRDANRGACTQPCRWSYRFYEEKRPDDVLSCEIYPEGSYIFGSKDLCMIEHIRELILARIDSFKIEGRMKSSYYAALVTNAYRIAMERGIDNSCSIDDLMRELNSVSHREYCTGYFFDGEMKQSNFATETGYIGEKSFLATVLSDSDEKGYALCRQNNKFFAGDACEFVTPGKCGQIVNILEMRDVDFAKIEACPHPQMEFYIKTEKTLLAGDLIRKNFV